MLDMQTSAQPETPLTPIATPAARVIALFGGGYKLGQLIKRHEATIYKWTWPVKRGGTGGAIPRAAQSLLIDAANKQGIALTYADFLPKDGEGWL